MQYVERRRSPRLDAADAMRAEILTPTVPVPVRLCNVSKDGFLIAAPVSFRPGSSHRCRFVSEGWQSEVLRAVSVHTRPDTHDPSVFVTGFRFVGSKRSSAQIAERLAAAALSFA